MTALPLFVVLAAGPTVELTAERLIHDDARKITTAEGEAELTARDAAMHADRITWDENAQGANASGHVALRLTRKGLMGIVGDVVSIRMEGDEVTEVFIYDGITLRKRNVTAKQLLAAKSQDAVRSIGTTTMSMTATHLKRDDDGNWAVDELQMTPCECDFDRPSWHIGTSKTTVDLQADRAAMLFPVIYVHDVPVFWFPWLSMPLSDRQSGLLVPIPTVTALSGFGVQAPVFLTLGRSADLTFTPSYYAGNYNSVYGIAGPRLLTEFRYTPSVGTSGRVSFGLIYDLRAKRDPMNPGLAVDGVTPLTPDTKFPRRGLRADGAWQHTQSLGHGWFDRVNAAFLSDGYYQRDFVADVLAREAGYLRSTATLFHRGDDHFVGIDAVVRQDLSTGNSIFDKTGPNPFNRLPGLTFAVPTKQIVGPLTFSVRAEAVRIAPTLGQVDTGYDPGTGVRNPFVLGDRESRDRLDLMPRLEVGGALGGVLGASAFAAWRQDVWFSEISKTTAQRGYPLLGARLDTELGRTFGSSVRHVIAPSLEIRAVPAVFGAAPVLPYDEIDLAVPDGKAHVQAVAQIRQRLLAKENGASREWLRLDLGQGADLLNPRLGESFARVSTSFWLARAAATVRVDPVLARVTRISALAAVDDNKGTGAYVSYENLLDDGTDRSRQPVDLLIGPAVSPTVGRAQVITCGLHWRWGSFGARYDAIFLQQQSSLNLLLQQQNPTLGLPTTIDPRLNPAQQTVGVSYSPACNCWRLEVFATYRGSGFPDVGATLTISGFGTLGTSG